MIDKFWFNTYIYIYISLWKGVLKKKMLWFWDFMIIKNSKFPMEFWVIGRHSGEILPRLSFNVERKTPRKDSGEILYDSGGNQYPPECYRKVWNKNESPSTVKTTFFWSVFGWNSEIPVRIKCVRNLSHLLSLYLIKVSLLILFQS